MNVAVKDERQSAALVFKQCFFTHGQYRTQD